MPTASSDRLRPSLILVALPPVAVAAGAVVLVLLGALGLNPFWSTTDLTMAEAAALRDQASVAAMARSGVDPSARMRVRPGMLDNRVELRMTPAEAAVRADRTEILDVLFANGLVLDDHVALGLVCRARQWDSEEALPYLTMRFPAAAARPCPDPQELV